VTSARTETQREPVTAVALRLATSRWGLIAVALLAMIPALAILSHEFVYDDLLIIRDNPEVHALQEPWRFFGMPYWPPQFIGGMYRPLSILLFSVQWNLGGGSPVLFHAVSILLYGALALAVLRLARLVLPPTAAWVAAALFAVHPVHTEAVASAVNQSELMVALLLVVATGVYLRGRLAGSLSGLRAAAVLGLYGLAVLVKEHALILPALLLSLEVTILKEPESLREKARTLRPFYLGAAAVFVGFLAIRGAVIQGGVLEAFPADALAGKGMGVRLLTMLGVVTEWARLLFWPAHLQIEYAPLEIETAYGLGPNQLLGLVLLLAAALVAWRTRKVAPAASFAALWMAVSLAPVHNVVIVTGVVLAERTLLLASLGVVVLAAVAFDWLGRRSASGMALPGAVVAVLLGLGAWRSADRYPTWKDQLTLFSQSVADAPMSYRAHYAYGDLLARIGRKQEAETEYLTAIALFPEDMKNGTVLARRTTRVYQSLGDLYRGSGLCQQAIEAYRSGLVSSASVEFNDARQSMIACLLYEGRYREAAAEARIGIAGEWNVPMFQRMLTLADSAMAVDAPPRSVQYTP